MRRRLLDVSRREKAPWLMGLLLILHVKEITLMYFLVVMGIAVPTALVNPLMVFCAASRGVR
jgi:hypothetical protein